ncbi:phosphatidate cytidylyltransferase [Actinoplanes sp. GCM10030250]|uniref:phosphatidate cytidylyltransferase n=1 Tax=Actinoplanes sp. GCM10030250 TaxID=3273376 RepID=UPI003605C934
MSYLDPRAGQAPGDDTSVPAPYVYDPSGSPEDPYADYRRSQPAPSAYPGQAWHADEPAAHPVNPPGSNPSGSNPPGFEPAPQGPEVLQTPPGPKGVKGRRRAGRGQTEKKGRAGRNLPAAIGVGLSLGLIVLASLLIEPVALLVVLVVASGIGVWEMARAMAVAGSSPPLIPLIAGSALMVGLAWQAGPDALAIGLAVTVGAAMLWRLADGVPAVRRDFTPSVLIAVYVPFLLSFAALLVHPGDGEPMDGAWRVIATLVAVVLSDTGGYASGVFLGKHPMAPRISPKKSWEGFAGSLTASAIGSSALLFFLLDVPVYWGLLFGAVISVVAVLGDLAESMLKRDLRIKDMSNLLPGHGGLMDRLDSILFAVPTAYLLFSIISPS